MCVKPSESGLPAERGGAASGPPGTVTLRPATMEDADLLLSWRNDPVTRRASHTPDEVGRTSHLEWLERVLADPDRLLFVAEVHGEPVGTVRADRSEGVTLLSWTVAPQARGRGIGKEMVRALVAQLGRPVRAEIKAWNRESARIAEYAGLTLAEERDGVLFYEARGA